MLFTAVGDTVLAAWSFGPDGLQPPVGGELQTKFVCGVGEVGHSFCLLAWSPCSQSASQQSCDTLQSAFVLRSSVQHGDVGGEDGLN